MEDQFPRSHPKPIKPPRRRRGRQTETANVRAWVKALNQLGVGFFWRVKNTGTWDPTRGFFRKDLSKDFVAIPDICGYLKKDGTAVFIEAKYIEGVEKKKKLIFSVKITNDQKRFLHGAHQAACLSGVAFTLDDCIAIVRNDPTRYVRHPRTYLFMPEEMHEKIIDRYKDEKKALSALRQDPVASATYLAKTHEEDWEKL